MDATTERKTKEMAKTVQKSAEVFAIGYDYNGTILSEVASGADHVYLSDPTTIVTKFTDIATIMGKANAGTDAVLTDNIGAKFVMTDAQGNKYTSEKFDITEAGKTFSFNIKINEEDITEDGWYPTNANFELTYTDPKGTTKTIKSTKNPEVYWVAKRYDYKIEYYYDGQIDNTLTETGKDVKGKEITVSEESIKNNTKEGYSFVNTDPSTRKIVISSSEENVIKVYYVTDENQTKELSYTVEYYKDGKKVENDTQVVKQTKQVLESDTLTVKKSEINVTNKYVGYKFEKTNPETIPNSINDKGVIKVYYVFDESQTKELSYTVEYYKNGKKVENDTQVEVVTVHVLQPNTLQVNQDKINTENKYVGYKLEKTSPETIPGEINNGGIIKVYYILDDGQTKTLTYTVNYYKDGNLVKEDTETIYETKQVLESDTLTVKSEEINIKDKYVGYKFVKTNPELIPEVIKNKGVIDVYYEKDTFTYEVRYYFNRVLDESLTEKGTALFGDKITSYTDKVKEDYTLETVENLPLVISEDESKNIINVYYKIDGQGVIEPIEPPHTSANNSIYALILLVNALGASVLLKKREN